MHAQFRRRNSRRKTRAARSVTALAVFALLAAGCGSTKSTSSPGGSTGSVATTSGSVSGTSGSVSGSGAVAAAQSDLTNYTGAVSSYPAVPPLSGVSSLKGKTIWYIPLGDSVTIFKVFGNGMQQATAKLGMKLHICDGMFLPTTVASCLSQAATQGASAVVTGYIDYALVPTAFGEVVAHHIPVLLAGESPDGGKTSSPQLAFYDTTTEVNVLQKVDDEEVIADSGGKAHIVYVGVTDTPTNLEAAAYTKSFFASHCPGCSFTQINYNTASSQRVPSLVSAALLANPGTNYVVGEVDADAAGIVSGVQTAGFANKVKLVAVDASLDSLQRIKAGQVQFADAGSSPLFSGWQWIDGVSRMMLGGEPVINVGGVRVFTKANVGSLTLTPGDYATNNWYGSDAYEQLFLTAWGVK